MNVVALLKGYKELVEKKLEKELKEQLELIRQDDVSVKKINNIKNLMINELKSINDSVKRDNNEEDLYSDKELEKIIKINDSKVKLTATSLNRMELVETSVAERKKKLTDIVNKVYLLTTYLESSEEVTKLLEKQRIINDDGFFNMDIV